MKSLIFAAKVAITGGTIWILLNHIDLAFVGAFLRSRDGIFALVIGVAILGFQSVLAAWRFRFIMRLSGSDLPFKASLSTWMVGLIVSQTLVTFVAGDVARIWELVRRKYTRRAAAAAVFLERALGFAVLMALVVVLLPNLVSQAQGGAVKSSLTALAALCMAGIGGFIFSGFLNALVVRMFPRLARTKIGAAILEVASAARYLVRSKTLSVNIIVLSALMHLCNVAVFYVLGRAAGIALDFGATAAVTLPVMLIALMPIALAGWGVREGAAAVGYALYGVAADTAVTVSIAFGVALLVASLPGGVILLVRGRTLRPPLVKTEKSQPI